MAEKKKEQAIKPITITDKATGKVYLLEFNRDSVKFAENRGFDINRLGDGLRLSEIEELFFCAFRMHQPKLSKADTDNILYDKLGGMPDGLVERLAELYLVPFQTLVRDEDSEKNAKMSVDF